MPKPQPLEDKIKGIRAEIDALIDAHVAEIKKVTPGVPVGVIRQTIVGYTGDCQCATYAALTEKGIL